MGTFIAKLENDDDHWFKMKDHVANVYDNLQLNDSIVYDPNNNMRDQWFRMENFDQNEAYLPLLDQPFDVAGLKSITRQQYDEITFLAFYENEIYYFQRVTKSAYLSKKWFAWNGDVISFHNEGSMIYINSLPNCVYDTTSKYLYFMDISKAYAIFSGIRTDYKEATAEDVDTFLSSDIVHSNAFDTTKVGLANRKRITSILNQYNTYSPQQRSTLKQYIHEKVGDKLNFEGDKFIISSDKDLRLLLYGIQQRFYVPPLSEETQVATNTTSINNLL